MGDLGNMLWEAVCHDLHLLQTNSIMILFKECHSPDSKPTAREISLHYPPSHPWGISFSAYGKEGCNLSSHDFDMQSSSSGIRMKCRLCGWKSSKVTYKDACEYIMLMDKFFPNVYWHSYPASALFVALFITATGHKKHCALSPCQKQGKT